MEIIINKNIVFKTSSLFLGLLVSIPALIIFSYIFIDSGNWEHLKETVLLEYITNSLYIMLGVGVLTSIIGFSTAYITTIYKFKFSSFFHYALIFPFAIPAYILAFIYGGMFDISGSVTTYILNLFDVTLADVYFFDIMSIEGAILVLSLSLYPYVYLLTKSYLRSESASIIDASKTLGLNGFQIFYKVVLPISRPAIVAGVILAVMEAVSDYGVMDYYGVSTFVTGIFRTWFGMGSVEDASKLASMLMFFIFLLIFLERFQRRNKKYKSSGKDFKPISKIELKGFKSFLAFALCFVPFFMGFLLPFGQMTLWFMESYSEIIDEEFFEVLINTLLLASSSAFIITILAFFFVYATRRTKSKTNEYTTQVAKLGYSIPGAVIAVGVLSFFAFLDKSVIDAFNLDFLISGTIIALVFGYTVRFLAISINSFESGFENIPQTYDDASKTLGIGEFKVLKDIYTPLLKTAFLGSLIMIFIEIIKELPLSMILRPFDFDTLAIHTYELTVQSQIVESSVPAMFIVSLGIISVILLAKNMVKD